jgi:putative ABC transport system ATP-binding protein
MTLLSFKHVSYLKNDKQILRDLSIEISTGDFVSVVGPSGSGKSTFLKLCCHLLSSTSGSIYYKGKSLMDYNPVDLRKNLVYCFQNPYLLGDTVLDNINFPYVIRSKELDLKTVEELFSRLNLNFDCLHKQVHNLSGGEKQRIALIRALLFKPEVLLLDEVTSALDVENSIIVEKAIQSLNQAGTTILWITHNPEQSRKHANKLVTIESGSIKSLEALR